MASEILIANGHTTRQARRAAVVSKEAPPDHLLAAHTDSERLEPQGVGVMFRLGRYENKSIQSCYYLRHVLHHCHDSRIGCP